MSAHLDCVVVGAGGWGTALACSLASHGRQTGLWVRRAELAKKLQKTRINERYLPGIQIPEGVVISSDLPSLIDKETLVILAIPVKGMRLMAHRMAEYVEDNIVISAAKGLEVSTSKRMSQVLTDELPTARVLALSGPNHAEEVARQHPTVTVVAGQQDTAKQAQELLMNPSFRVYTNNDLVGVELCGAVKNVIAIAAGISDGLGFGDNTKSAVITRGLAEISRLGMAFGASPLTFAGIAGMGDLIATCTSPHSRNRQAGEWLGQGREVGEFTNSGQVVEGIPTTQGVLRLARQINEELPIVEGVAKILDGAQPRLVVEELMERVAKKEIGSIF